MRPRLDDTQRRTRRMTLAAKELRERPAGTVRVAVASRAFAKRDRMALEAGIEATRREAAYDESGPEHGAGLRLSARW